MMMRLMPLLRSIVLLAVLVLSAPVWAGDVTWIDVRTAEEYSQQHVPDALNIPHDHIGNRVADVGLAKDTAIHLYCRTGRRAGLAKETLESLGYTRVVNSGGLDAALLEAAADPQD
jgi:phage shock protein E